MNTKDEYYNETFRLVGVTYDNEDGTNRQKLLEDIKLFRGSNGCDYKKGELSVELVRYKFEEEDAIRVEVGIFKDVIGHISRKDLPLLLENYEYIHEIPFLDVYYGTPYGCSVTVTFKNPNYIPPAAPVSEPINEPVVTQSSLPQEETPRKTGFFSKLFKK